MERSELTAYLDDYLRIDEIDDYGPQGLQVEASGADVARLALAVDAALPAIEAAAEWDAQMLLVHHGILWRTVERIAGPLGRRVRRLLDNDLHLYAAHLPLDAHPTVGNNARLAQLLGVTVDSWWCVPTNVPIGVVGAAPPNTHRDDLATQLERKLETNVRLLAYGPEQVQTVAIITGFGADQIGAAKEQGADTFITGETSHANYWAASEHGLNVLYAGHYATETVGVRALGAHLADRFGLDVKFFDFPTRM
jgi:dinuclear metal center YbgI/SA1388 family protein